MCPAICKKGFGGLLLVVLGVGSRPRRCASSHASKERNFHTRRLEAFRFLTILEFRGIFVLEVSRCQCMIGSALLQTKSKRMTNVIEPFWWKLPYRVRRYWTQDPNLYAAAELRSQEIQKPRNLGFSRFLSQIALCVMRRLLGCNRVAELVAYRRQRLSLLSI